MSSNNINSFFVINNNSYACPLRNPACNSSVSEHVKAVEEESVWVEISW